MASAASRTCAECGATPIKAKGLCNKHYMRMTRAARPEAAEAIARRYAEKKRMLAIVAWYDAELAKVDAGAIKRPIGEVLIDHWQIEGAIALLTKLQARRDRTLVLEHEPDYEFTGGLLRCLEAGREALGRSRRVA